MKDQIAQNAGLMFLQICELQSAAKREAEKSIKLSSALRALLDTENLTENGIKLVGDALAEFSEH